MTRHFMHILTIIPRDEIMGKGIYFLRSILYHECKIADEMKKTEDFWVYFENGWFRSDGYIATWNVCDKTMLNIST